MFQVAGGMTSAISNENLRGAKAFTNKGVETIATSMAPVNTTLCVERGAQGRGSIRPPG